MHGRLLALLPILLLFYLKLISHDSSAVALQMGAAYAYTLTLNSSFLAVSSFGVAGWSTGTGGAMVLDKLAEKPYKVYAVNPDFSIVDYKTATTSAVGVAVIAGEHKFMIAKDNAHSGSLNWGKTLYGKYVAGITNVSGGGQYIGDGEAYELDFTTWTTGVLSDFNGKANTEVITAASSYSKDMCTVLNTFNASDSFKYWYVPALGQLALMYLNMTEINAALAKIGGTALAAESYWSSSEYSSNYAWYVNFNRGRVSRYGSKGGSHGSRVRFVRDI